MSYLIFKKSALIDKVIQYLKTDSKILGHKLDQPVIRRGFSDYKKKYSQIHRIEVYEPGRNNYKRYFWVKIAINQSAVDAARKITKEYKIQEELFQHFSKITPNKPIALSSSKSVAVLYDYNAVISQECSGVFFNTYLQRHLPFFYRKEILQHCKNLGMWLKEFHEFYREKETNPVLIDSYMSNFRNRFKKDPLPDLSFITCCHRDYSPRNVFVDKNRVEVIDFVGVEKGLPQEDIEFFSNYVLSARFNGLYTKKYKQQMVNCFIEGYGISMPMKQL